MSLIKVPEQKNVSAASALFLRTTYLSYTFLEKKTSIALLITINAEDVLYGRDLIFYYWKNSSHQERPRLTGCDCGRGAIEPFADH